MNPTNLKKEAPIIIIALIPALVLWLNWQALPDQLPTHWNYKGVADDYGPKYILPIITAGVYLLMLFIPLIDPRKKNYDIFSNTYYKLRIILVFFIAAISVATMAKGLGYNIQLNKMIHMAVTLMFVVLGNYMGNIRPNWFIGVRTPWTLENDEVWKRTHRLAGKLWFWGGLVAFILTFFIKIEDIGIVILGLVVPLAVVPIIYSYIIYKQIKAVPTQNHQD